MYCSYAVEPRDARCCCFAVLLARISTVDIINSIEGPSTLRRAPEYVPFSRSFYITKELVSFVPSRKGVSVRKVYPSRVDRKAAKRGLLYRRLEIPRRHPNSTNLASIVDVDFRFVGLPHTSLFGVSCTHNHDDYSQIVDKVPPEQGLATALCQSWNFDAVF